MRTGMLADYSAVAKRTLQVRDRVKDVRSMHITSTKGTELHARLDPPRYRWHPWTGLYHQPGEWGNLPEGETFTTPAYLQGVIAAQVLGDFFSEKYGLLDEPVMMFLEGELVKVEHPDAMIARDVWDFLSSAENGRRPGEFAIGTNEFLRALTGNLLQDEKYPGLHVAFGNPYPVTGGDWSSPVHVDVVPVGVSIWADGEQIMDQGRFTI
jgi:aminopeptidase